MDTIPHPARYTSSSIVNRFFRVDVLRRLSLFAGATVITSFPLFSPAIGNSEIRLIWVPLALLSFVFTWLPRQEAPIYALIYATVTLAHESHLYNLGFDLASVGLEIAQALGLALLVPRHLTRRQMILQPFRVIGYIVAALLITLIGASLTLLAAGLSGLSAHDIGEELGGNAALAWRYWWLGHACGFVTITGAMTFLWQVSRADWAEVLDEPRELRLFVLLVALQLAVTLFVMPVVDLSWIGLPPGVRLGMLFIPVMTAIALTTRFKGFGAALAILTTTPIAILSAGGPHAVDNWAGLPPMATPVHLILITTATACWVLAPTLRHLQWALNDAVAASQAKTRFVAMLNHELRTPLNAILGFSELMRLKNIRDIDEAIGPIENIHASGQRLLAMIEGLLSQADRGASVFELHRQHVNLKQTIEDTIAEMQAQFDEVGCTVEVRADQDIHIDADPKAFKQILLVLLSYPLRFCGTQTEIRVSAERLETDTVVEVSSTGMVGALADDRDKIEVQLVNAIALAHGARMTVPQQSRESRIVRLTFFATHAR